MRVLCYCVFLIIPLACQGIAFAQPLGGYCEGCEGIYEGLNEQKLSAVTTIAGASEPGQRIEISGVIYRPDGKTPAADVILYVYHTDNNGYYTPSEDASGWTRRHGRLRGWMKTGSNGEYTFHTIKPAPYPRGSVPAHIHPTIKEPGKREYYIDEYLFDGDPLLTSRERSRQEKRGGSGIIRLEKGPDGILRARRDIILGMNIPNYK